MGGPHRPSSHEMGPHNRESLLSGTAKPTRPRSSAGKPGTRAYKKKR